MKRFFFLLLLISAPCTTWRGYHPYIESMPVPKPSISTLGGTPINKLAPINIPSVAPTSPINATLLTKTDYSYVFNTPIVSLLLPADALGCQLMINNQYLANVNNSQFVYNTQISAVNPTLSLDFTQVFNTVNAARLESRGFRPSLRSA